MKSIDEIRKAWQVQLFGNKETNTGGASSNTMTSSSGTCKDATTSEQPHRKQKKRRHDGTGKCVRMYLNCVFMIDKSTI